METVNYGRNKLYDTGPWCLVYLSVTKKKKFDIDERSIDMRLRVLADRPSAKFIRTSNNHFYGNNR
jgi:hypothetical protein